MYELHEYDQYFFNDETLSHLVSVVSKWDSPCCLCAPLLGKRLSEDGVEVTILDIDERFSTVRGFRKYNVYRPEHLPNKFGLIFCDPPFFKVSLSQLFAAVHVLSQWDFCQPLMISYLKRRESAIMGTFAPFDLKPTGYNPTYQTVQACERNVVEFYANVEVARGR